MDRIIEYIKPVHYTYLGPKKTLKWMETNQSDAFNLYRKALFDFSEDSLANWIKFLEKVID